MQGHIIMESKFIPAEVEKALYEFWEQQGLFKAEVDKKKKPFSIILPPPNANGHLHMGHAMFAYEDILIRYHKLIGDSSYWQLGLDHAGFETQYVFEKHLRKEGKSRFDFDRETLYQNIWDFVMSSKHIIKGQMRRLGFSLDWSREKFTMDTDVVAIVHETFKKLFDAGLIYRAERLVNYCTRDGTSFSDLEIESKEMEGTFYYVKFPLEDGRFITIATTRPETMLGDVAVMVHPEDKRYKHLIGKNVILPISNRKVPIIADTYVDKKFGTGAVKVTPVHDPNDFEIAKKHNLYYPAVIGFNGRMQNAGDLNGLNVKAAREEVVKRLKEAGLLEKEKPHKMVVKTCYRCGNVLEPLPLEQWYIKVKPLTSKAIEAVKTGEIKIVPKRFERILIAILENFIDWNISRQIVWGIRIPAYKCKSQNKWFVSTCTPPGCTICGGDDFEQDPDTLDTWFSSSQWPFVTLKTQGEEFYKYFYPTSVMETGHDILRAWVARMIMMGYFATDKKPFDTVFLHGMVRDGKGMKMSKSKGNVIDPLSLADKYGADALRAALIFGTKEGGDVVMSEQKVVGMRNFANKVWNIGRFIYMNKDVTSEINIELTSEKKKELAALKKEFDALSKKYIKKMNALQISMAFDETYHFLWHRFADNYIETFKEELHSGNREVYDGLKEVYEGALKQMHPFMPFVTEAIWQVFNGKESSIMREHL